MAQSLSDLLIEDVEWCWTITEHDAFKMLKRVAFMRQSWLLTDPDRPFSVVCDASDFAIDSALL